MGMTHLLSRGTVRHSPAHLAARRRETFAAADSHPGMVSTVRSVEHRADVLHAGAAAHLRHRGGASRLELKRFIVFAVSGACMWAALLLAGGYWRVSRWSPAARLRRRAIWGRSSCARHPRARARFLCPSRDPRSPAAARRSATKRIRRRRDRYSSSRRSYASVISSIATSVPFALNGPLVCLMIRARRASRSSRSPLVFVLQLDDDVANSPRVAVADLIDPLVQGRANR